MNGKVGCQLINPNMEVKRFTLVKWTNFLGCQSTNAVVLYYGGFIRLVQPLTKSLLAVNEFSIWEVVEVVMLLAKSWCLCSQEKQLSNILHMPLKLSLQKRRRK